MERQLLGSVFDRIIELCARRGFRPAFVQETSQAASLHYFVAAGTGIALVPSSFVQRGQTGVAARALADRGTWLETVVVSRHGKPSAAVRGFLQTLGRMAAERRWVTRAMRSSRRGR